MVYVILLCVALVFAVLAAVSVPSPPRLAVQWGWLAVAVWLLAIIVRCMGLR